MSPDDTRYRLIDRHGEPCLSAIPGQLGGHHRRRVYGRLDCPVALSLIGRGKFKVDQRVFFADEATAVAAGYRPCGACMREAYRAWKGEGCRLTRRRSGSSVKRACASES